MQEARERAIGLPGGRVFPAGGEARSEAQRREGDGVGRRARRSLVEGVEQGSTVRAVGGGSDTIQVRLCRACTSFGFPLTHGEVLSRGMAGARIDFNWLTLVAVETRLGGWAAGGIRDTCD